MKTKRISLREKRQGLKMAVLPEVRKLVGKSDLAAVGAALNAIRDERKAQRALRIAEAKVEELKRKLKV
jgi:hypothetical protein